MSKLRDASAVVSWCCYFLKARGTSNWKFRLRRQLPAGRYAVWARARSASGATSRVARVNFKLRP